VGGKVTLMYPRTMKLITKKFWLQYFQYLGNGREPRDSVFVYNYIVSLTILSWFSHAVASPSRLCIVGLQCT